MKIAIASKKETLDSDISDLGGRAPFYLVFGEKGELLEKFENPSLGRGGGAAFIVIKELLERGVNVFVAGEIGYKMSNFLKENNINFYERSGQVSKVLDEILKK